MIPPDLAESAAALLAAYRRRGLRIATAESCTGGLLAGLLTEAAGSSDVFERGFVVYSNAAKSDLLAVDPALIEANGAVSEAVARAMAEGALQRSWADVAISVTGIAGPGGGTAAKPVGLVHLGLAGRDRPTTTLERRYGDLGRGAVRLATLRDALDLLAGAAR